MAADFRNIVIAFIVAGLFVVSMISWGTAIGLRHNQTSNFADGGIVGLDLIESSLSSDLGNVQDQGNKWQQSITEENIQSEPGGIVMFSLWSVIKTSWDVSNGVMSLIFGGVSIALCIPPIAVGVLVTILLLTLTIGAWKVLKQGE